MSDSTSRTPSVAAASPANLENAHSGLPQQSSGASHFATLVDRTVIAQSPIAAPGEFYPTGTVASLAKVLIGQKLDHFQLHELVGGGGMGAVFRASDTRLDRVVAVKVIPNLGRDLETLRRFRFEAQSAAKLDHPHIARVYYVGETEAWSYIVFEYVEGVNLRDLVIRQGPLSIDDAVYYACQVAEALQHASERSVVHRDIKPSNVLVTPEGIVKVVDMGLARTTALDRSTNDLTASGVTLGTFDYISPEQARDPRAADVRSDLYSLGCTLYYMLTGRPPYPEGTAMQKLLMHGSVQADDPRDFRDDISSDLSAILRKLMAKKPSDRYQNPTELIADLQCLANLEQLARSQHAVGRVVAPITVDRTVFEMVMPWLVAVLAVLGSTWYLYAQHRNTASFVIPNLSVPVKAVVADRNFPSLSTRDGLLPNGGSPKNESPLGPFFDKMSDIDSIFEFPTSETEGTKTSSDAIASPPLLDLFSQPDSKNDSKLNSGLGLLSATTLQSQTPIEQGANRLQSNARVLWVRPFESTDSETDQGLEYRVLTGTLADALAMADAEPDIEELWLDDDVWLVDSTLELRRELLAIRSAPDRKARIELRIPRKIMSPLDGNALNEKMVAIDVGSNQLILDDLDLFMVSPDSGSGSMSMIGLAPGGSIRVMHSTMTLAANGTTWKTSGFGLKPEISASSLTLARAPLEPRQIEMEDVVFRGEGDLVAMEAVQRTELHWRNGLLAVSGRMLELGGARDFSRTPPTIRIDLEQVTIAARQGFARIRLSKDHPFPICLSRDSKNCTYTSDEKFPLVAIENAETGEDGSLSEILASWLDLHGRDNAYDEQIDTLVRWSSPQGSVSRIGFESAAPEYFSERAPESSVRWLGSHPVEKPFEQQTAGDYLQRDGSFRPGFRAELLPNH